MCPGRTDASGATTRFVQPCKKHLTWVSAWSGLGMSSNEMEGCAADLGPRREVEYRRLTGGQPDKLAPRHVRAYASRNRHRAVDPIEAVDQHKLLAPAFAVIDPPLQRGCVVVYAISPQLWRRRKQQPRIDRHQARRRHDRRSAQEATQERPAGIRCHATDPIPPEDVGNPRSTYRLGKSKVFSRGITILLGVSTRN